MTLLRGLIIGLAPIWALVATIQPAMAQTTELVSVDSVGGQGNSISFLPSISADSRFVVFASFANNLVAGDTNGRMDIFVHDRQTGVTERVNVDSAGNQALDFDSDRPSISADGRFVAFDSHAGNLVANDTNPNGQNDIFVHDRLTGITELVSVDSAGNQGFNFSFFASISADGRFVAFDSASQLAVGDTNGAVDVFVHDRLTGETELVSVDSAGTQGNGNRPKISADGRFVAFESFASNLVAGDTNGDWDVFVHDRLTGVTERVSVDSAGNQGNNFSFRPSISADGRFVAFDSRANNLATGDTNGRDDVFVRDRQNGVTELVSANLSGTLGNNFSVRPSISADGRFVAFDSLSSNLVAGDTNGQFDIFVRNRGSANQPPVADAGPDQNVTATGATGALVTLDGSGSSDPDGDSLTYGWSGPSGIANGVGPTVSLPLGTHVITLEVDDGTEIDSDVVQITVLFDFLGFRQPVESYPVLNTAKAGRSIPIKWQVSDGAGGFLGDLGIVAALQFAPVSCDAEDGAFENPVDADDSGNSGLRYDTVDEQYIYSWKTAKGMKDTCHLFGLTLTDGTTHLVRFKLK